MKKIFIAFVLVLFSICGYSQVKTIYFDTKDQVTTDSLKAASYAIYGKLTGDSLWSFKKYDSDGYMTATGSFKDDSLSIPHGKFVYYDWIDPNKSIASYNAVAAGRDRYIVIIGNFKDGFRQGIWRSFYENGRVKSLFTFDKGLMQGACKSYDVNGNLEESGQYTDNKKSGEWVSSNGLIINTYENGQLISTIKKTKKELKEETKKN